MTKYVVSQIQAYTTSSDEMLKAQRDAMMGWEFLQENSIGVQTEFYTQVMEVEAESLDHVFHLTNVWNDLSRVTTLTNRRGSTSVGDLIKDVETGVVYMVDGCGFRNVATGEQV